MRAVRLVGHEAATVERRARTNAIGHRCGGLHNQRTAPAITLCTDFLGAIHLRLLIEEPDVRGRIPLNRTRRVRRCHQPLQLGHIGLVLEIEHRGVLEQGSLGKPVERIRNEHRIAFCGDPLGDVSHHRPQAKCIGPNQHTRMDSRRGMDECGIACSVGRFNRDVRLHDRQRCRLRRTRGDRERRRDRNCDEVPARRIVQVVVGFDRNWMIMHDAVRLIVKWRMSRPLVRQRTANWP